MSKRRFGMWLYTFALGIPGGLLLQAAQPGPSHAEQAATPRPTTLRAAAAAPYRSKQKRLQSRLQGEDARALLALHELHDAEISIGRLAQSRAKSAQARRSGQQLALDHMRRDQYVIALARKRGVALTSPTPPEADTPRAQQRKAMIERLQTLTGHEFDREFGRAMVEGNASAIGLVAQQRTRVHDPDLRLLIDGTLPMLKQHMDIAHRLSLDASPSH